jgi:hypothetical protein
MNKLISLVGSVGLRQWRLKGVFVLAILLVVAVTSTNSTAQQGNTATGFNALFNNTTGSGNTATGEAALFFNGTGSSNTATGASALRANTTGNNNTATGSEALFVNTTGNSNTATGQAALRANTTGFDNTATGVSALRANTEGVNNTATGRRALGANTTGQGNTAMGVEALFNNTDGISNTATGVQALFNNRGGIVNTATGRNALRNNTTGNDNTAMGAEALTNNMTGDRNTAVGFDADVTSEKTVTNATAIGAGASVDESNKVRLGNDKVTVIEGQVGFTSSSDARRKENFLPMDREETLRKLSQLTVGSWNFKGQDPTRFRHYGPNAQEFFAAFGHDDLGTIGSETTITTTDIDGIMLLAIQALEQRTIELQEELRRAREELAQLQAEKRAGVTEVESP